jgi:uncharacterized protein (UPF0276 family)
MPSVRACLTGIALADESTARWVEAQAETVACVEIVAEGFFTRSSPYLAWLGARFPIVLRAPWLSLDTNGAPRLESLGRLQHVCDGARARYVTQPLGFSESDAVRVKRPVPFSCTQGVLQTLAAHFEAARSSTGRTFLIEVITAPLRLPGSIPETEFLVRLCQKAGCGLLIDVTTLLVAGRNHGFDPHEWLREIPKELIAAARIGGSSWQRGRWRHDPTAEIEAGAWDLLGSLLTCSVPEVLLLNQRDRPEGITALERDLDRLRLTDARTDVARAPTTMESTLEIREQSRANVSDDAGRIEPPADAPDPACHAATVAAEVALFVLDREGVFFSEAKHELTLFNTTATFVWCLLEDGTPPQEIVTAYADTFGVASAAAEQQVGTILRHWFGRGYITHPGSLPADPPPFTTALAWLLTNPALRMRFRDSPAAVANLLGLTGEDRTCFVALDPKGLDAQAQEDDVADPAKWVRPVPAARSTNETGGGEAHAAAEKEVPSQKQDQRAPNGPVRQYRLLSTTFSVIADSSQVLERLDEALGHLVLPVRMPEDRDQTTPGQTEARPLDRHPGRRWPAVRIEIRPSESARWRLLEDDATVTECHDEGLVPAVKQLLRERSVDNHPFLLSVHAGAVAFGNNCVLLPAAAGSGKTTLTAALVHAGATLFSDEIALLDDRMSLTPVPLSLTIKDGSVEPLRALYPEVDTLPVHIREDYVRVRYLPPRATSMRDPDQAATPKWVVFPCYNSAVETCLQPLERPEALRRLLEESFIPTRRLTRNRVESLVQWMRGVDCYLLPFSSLAAAVTLVRDLAHPDSAG